MASASTWERIESQELRLRRRRTRHYRPGDRPDPSRPAGADTLPQIKHIVVLLMENHSFDNYLGTLGRGEGFPLGADGTPDADHTSVLKLIEEKWNLPALTRRDAAATWRAGTPPSGRDCCPSDSLTIARISRGSIRRRLDTPSTAGRLIQRPLPGHPGAKRVVRWICWRPLGAMVVTG